MEFQLIFFKTANNFSPWFIKKEMVYKNYLLIL